MVSETVSVLKITLLGDLIGYLAGYSSGKNVLTLAPDYLHNDEILHAQPGWPLYHR